MAADHKHSTPLTAVTDNDDGTYTATIYYLMPSSMNGLSMGTWDLGVTVDKETVHFNPNVMMSMGDTALVKLKGVDDKVTNMDGLTVGRTYTIFKESLMGDMGNYNFKVFIVAQETMMSFPAVFDGSSLSGNTLNATVEFSEDDGVTWTVVDDGPDGFWSVNGLTLTDVADETAEIRVRLTVDDTVVKEVKTTNGTVAVDGVNDYQTFTVTPVTSGGMVM